MDMSVGSHSKHSGSGGSGSKNSGGSSTSRTSRRSGSPASIDKAEVDSENGNVKMIHQQFVNEGREQPPGGQQETPMPMQGQDYNFWDGKRAE